jgi:hypothetical protein
MHEDAQRSGKEPMKPKAVHSVQGSVAVEVGHRFFEARVIGGIGEDEAVFTGERRPPGGGYDPAAPKIAAAIQPGQAAPEPVKIHLVPVAQITSAAGHNRVGVEEKG